MRRSALATVAALLLSSFLSAQESVAHPLPIPLTTKVERLRFFFRELDLSLPALPDSLTGHEDFELLQSFSAQVHKRALAQPAPAATKDEWQDLARISYPGGVERIVRAAVVKTEVIQQPKLVQIADATGQLSYQPNPGKLLWKVSSTTDYGQVVPTVADVQAQAAALDAAGVDLSTAGAKAFCSSRLSTPDANHYFTDVRGRFKDCLLRTGGAYMSARIASSFKLTFNWAQNPKVNSTFKYVVPSQYANVNQVFSGQVDFDPSKIFVTGSDWQSAYKAADSYGDAQEGVFARYMASKCEQPADAQSDGFRKGLVTTDCVRKLARPRGWVVMAAVLTPTVSLVEKSNFDFLASNGVLAPNPFTTKRLADLTFSLDLTRVLPSAKARQDALAALVAAKAKKPRPPVNPTWKDVDDLVGKWAMEPEKLNADADDSLYEKLISALHSLRQAPLSF